MIHLNKEDQLLCQKAIIVLESDTVKDQVIR
jgi:hypothetical protein